MENTVSRYYTLNQYLRETFGCKVYKLALDGGMTCPNRDGTLGTRGCIFCSAEGSGEFAQSAGVSPVWQQIEEAKSRVGKKMKEGRYIAYLRAHNLSGTAVFSGDLPSGCGRIVCCHQAGLSAAGCAGIVKTVGGNQTGLGGAGTANHSCPDGGVHPQRV